MKIKLILNLGSDRGMSPGSIFDAAVSPNKEKAYVFDRNNSGWYLEKDDFLIMEESAEETTEECKQKTSGLPALFGQTLKSMQVEFK